MDHRQDELRDQLKAIFASSCEFPAEHDDALADLLFAQLGAVKCLYLSSDAP